MPADTPPHSPAGADRPSRWRAWRRGRPFTAGVLVTLAGVEMLTTLRAPLGVILHVGPQGLAAYLVPIILLICGVLLIVQPQQRVFHGLVSLVLALVSWLTSNLGGFLIGMLLALVGASLALAWTPAKTPRRASHARHRAPGATAAASRTGQREAVADTATEAHPRPDLTSG